MNAPTSPAEPASGDPAARSSRSAGLVAAGILLSRISGLIRLNLFARFFGTSIYAEAFAAALRMPNVIQNLLGEGTLSASFIPVYAELISQGRKEEAGRVAGAIFALLFAIAAGFALIGIVAAPLLATMFVPGFEGQRREITIVALRIIFPMTGILVLSAWALGILNSHRRFFLSYVAPVLWNAAMIATLLYLGPSTPVEDLTIALAWGALAGGVLQFAVQVPTVLRLERELRVRLTVRFSSVRTVLRNAVPAVLGRGVVQLSSLVDLILASVISVGAVAALDYAQRLYLLPISLFGMSIAAAELPELSRERGAAQHVIQGRVNVGLRRLAVFVAPSVVGLLALGDVIVAALYQSGRFGPDDTVFVQIVLAGYTLGLMASTATRLFSSAFYALQDTRTPAIVASVRVTIAAGVGAASMFWLERFTVNGHALGALGLSLAASLAAWIEWQWLRRNLGRRIGKVGPGTGHVVRLFGAAAAAAAIARLALMGLGAVPASSGIAARPIPTAVLILPLFAVLYFAFARLLGVSDAGHMLRALLRRR